MQTTTSRSAQTQTATARAREHGDGPDPGVLLLLLLAMLLLNVLTLRHGHSWHDDFALYILHARNIVEGRAYAETGYLYNPADPLHSPQAYPPGFPLLLTPLYALFGADLYLLRMVVIASFVGAVAVLAAIARPVLPPRYVVAVVALAGFQPFLLRFKNQLLPDMSFMLFAFAALLLLRRLQESEDDGRSIGVGLLAGVCVAAAVSMRMVGVALFAAVPLYYALRWKLPRRGVVAAGVTAVVLVALQAFAMPATSAYGAQMADMEEAGWSPGPSRPFHTLLELASVFRVAWAPRGELWAYQLGAFDQGMAVLATTIMLLLAAVGFIGRVRRPTIIETFTLSYVLVLLYWGFISARYVVPLIPLLLLYAVLGAWWLGGRGIAARRGMAALGIAAGLMYAANLARIQRGPYSPDVASEQSRELFGWIRACTDEDVVLASLRPRALALFTERRATTFGGEPRIDADEFVRRLEARGVRYLVTFNGSPWDSLSSRSALLEPAWSNPEFNVWRAQGVSDVCR